MLNGFGSPKTWITGSTARGAATSSKATTVVSSVDDFGSTKTWITGTAAGRAATSSKTAAIVSAVDCLGSRGNATRSGSTARGTISTVMEDNAWSGGDVITTAAAGRSAATWVFNAARRAGVGVVGCEITSSSLRHHNQACNHAS
jgi:hypothetical protein